MTSIAGVQRHALRCYLSSSAELVAYNLCEHTLKCDLLANLMIEIWKCVGD